jgi:hypothetical protein
MIRPWEGDLLDHVTVLQPYLQILVKLVEIFWICEIKIVRIVHELCSYNQKEDKVHPIFKTPTIDHVS